MTLSALAAKRVCKRSGWTISNLKLQKILYMAQLIYAGEHNGQKLMEAQFQAWDYGPVEPSIYEHVSRFGRAPITDIFAGVDDGEGTDEAKALDCYTDQLLHYSGGELVNMTHW